VISAARVVFNIKSRMARETAWQLELKGDLTKQRRVEAVDKLLSVLTLLVGTVFGLQAIGLDGARAAGRARAAGPGLLCRLGPFVTKAAAGGRAARGRWRRQVVFPDALRVSGNGPVCLLCEPVLA